MAIKVTLGTPVAAGAVVSGGGSISRGSGVTVGSAVTQSTTRSLSEIQDIITTDQSNNSVVVFNAALNKYEVKPLPSDSIDEATIEAVLSQGNVNMDGGSF